jgi:hypothetical protein
MPELGTFGSVRGVPGNRHSYRDQKIPSAGDSGTIGGSAIQHARGGMRRG